MINNIFLIKLTEGDKRVIFVLLAVLILLLILIAYIGFLVTKVMQYQGKKINNHVTEVVVTGVIDNERDFRRYATKKNFWLFYRQARIPFIFVLASVAFYIITGIILGFYNPFDMNTGFGSLLFIWDFSTIITVPESGAGLLINWPAQINTPHFVAEAWPSYVFVPCIFISGIWYLVNVQALIARGLQINKLGRKIFSEQIEHFVPGSNNNPQPVNTQPINPTDNQNQ